MAQAMPKPTRHLPLLLLLLPILANSLPTTSPPTNARPIAGEAAVNGNKPFARAGSTNPPPAVPTTGNQSQSRKQRWRRYNRNMVREFLRSHNAIRLNFKEPPFAWDRTLAGYARRWSKTRSSSCDGAHSGGPYGENMFWGTGTRWRAADAVKSWADEQYYYDATANSCRPGQTCGHFTQIVWNTTIMIGCGRAECVNGGVVIVCNYYPAGNYLGESPFQS